MSAKWQNQQCRVPTSDNWYPTASDGCVLASCVILANGQFRTCVWGEDNYGLELDVDCAEVAQHWYERIKATDCITIERLKQWGFTVA